MDFLIIIEKGSNNYSAYSPDLPGCAATGKSVEETLSNMKEVVEFHLEGVAESGETVPTPKSLNYYLEETDEISSDDILAHVHVEPPQVALAH